MAPPAGPPKQPVQVRLSNEELTLLDTFAAELSRQAYGAAFSRAEALKLAALTWLRERSSTPPIKVTTAALTAPAGGAVPGHSIVTEPNPPTEVPKPPAPPRSHGLPLHI